jgi:hypothetical protein
MVKKFLELLDKYEKLGIINKIKIKRKQKNSTLSLNSFDKKFQKFDSYINAVFHILIYKIKSVKKFLFLIYLNFYIFYYFLPLKRPLLA